MKRAATLLAVFTMLLVFVRALAQEQKENRTPAMPKPQFGPELARLSFLVGDFTTETFISSNPLLEKRATGKGTAVIKWDLDSMFLVIHEESQNKLLGNYKGHGLLGYLSSDSLYKLWMFNNFGDRPSYQGHFNGDTLVFEAKVPAPGGSFEQRVLWFHEGNRLILQVLNDFGKGFAPVLVQTYNPVTKPSKKNLENKPNK